MQNDINNIDKPDAFSEIFRQKLENHQVPVDPNSWNEIEAKMKGQKRRIIPFWFWLSGGAAAVLALFFILRPVSEPTRFALENSNLNILKVTSSKPVGFLEKNRIAKTETKKTNSEKPKPTISIDSEKYISKVTTNKADSIENKTAPDIAQNNITKNETGTSSTENRDSVSTRKSVFPKALNEDMVNMPVVKNKNKKDWLLAASFGSGGGAPNGSNGYEADIFNAYYNEKITSGTSFTSGLMDSRDFSRITYNSPLSFGLVVRKNLDKTISVESGLVYTYLSTNFENNGVQQNNAKLHLHYIGLPLNLVGVVWRNSKWEIYISGGAMVEKGIRSVYVLNQIYGTQKITTTASTGIDGFQWSVNGAIGTTYKIQRNIGIFFEPKLSYFFDNNQPVSARTDQPTVIGLTAGLRFQF